MQMLGCLFRYDTISLNIISDGYYILKLYLVNGLRKNICVLEYYTSILGHYFYSDVLKYYI